MKRNKEERSGSRWGARGVIAAAVFGAVLAVTPVQAQIPQVPFGSCGPMDVVFVIDTTGSMEGAIQNIKADISTPGTGIIDTILNAAGEDGIPAEEARLGLVTVSGFTSPTIDLQQYDCLIADPNIPVLGGVGDCIIVVRDLGSDIMDVESSITNLPLAAGGGPLPEITNEALRTILEGVDQTGDVVGGPTPNAAAPGVISGDPNDWPRLQWNNWNGAFTAPTKVIFLVTDNAPGGTDSFFDAGDVTSANNMALAAAAQGIIIQPILVALEDGSFDPNALAVMQNYADVTGGQLTQVPFSGEGTALAIISVIENCGTVPAARLLIIDEDSIDNGAKGVEAISFKAPYCGNRNPAVCVNDDIATINSAMGSNGLRKNRQPLFTRRKNVTNLDPATMLVLRTGQVGDYGLFQFTLPDLQTSQQTKNKPFSIHDFVFANGNAGNENNLDKINGVMPLGKEEIEGLLGETVCAVVYDSDITSNVKDGYASLKGATMGLTAFKVVEILPSGGSSSSLPRIKIELIPSSELVSTCESVIIPE